MGFPVQQPLKYAILKKNINLTRGTACENMQNFI